MATPRMRLAIIRILALLSTSGAMAETGVPAHAPTTMRVAMNVCLLYTRGGSGNVSSSAAPPPQLLERTSPGTWQDVLHVRQALDVQSVELTIHGLQHDVLGALQARASMFRLSATLQLALRMGAAPAARELAHRCTCHPHTLFRPERAHSCRWCCWPTRPRPLSPPPRCSRASGRAARPRASPTSPLPTPAARTRARRRRLTRTAQLRCRRSALAAAVRLEPHPRGGTA